MTPMMPETKTPKTKTALTHKIIVDFSPLTRAEREYRYEHDMTPEMDIDEAEPDDDSLGEEARHGW